MSGDEFAIISIGMTTAVGWDAASSCASFRAGISRAEDLDYAEYFSDEEAELTAITGHIASERAMECEGLGKMIALGIDALRDLLANRDLPPELEQVPTGFFLALPNYSLRQESFVDVNARMMTGGPSAESFLAEPESEEDPLLSLRFATECNRHLAERLFNAAGIKVNITLKANIYGHRAAFLLCLQQAMRVMRSGQVQRCIVGAIDSLLEADVLEWAVGHGRLKTTAVPCGFSPGEAAVFFEIVRSDRLGSSSSVAAYVTEPEIVADVAESGDSRNPGSRLAQAIRSVLLRAHLSTVGLAIGDLNGEYERALEWGYAVNRLLPRFPCFQALRSWQPAEAFGETGCASAGLAIGVGIQSFRRNYALADTILVWCSSEDHLKGALILRSATWK